MTTRFKLLGRCRWAFASAVLLLASAFSGAAGADNAGNEPGFEQFELRRISMSAQEAEIAEVLGMLSKQERVNILLSSDVRGTVSFNLFDVSLGEAIEQIANAAGFAIEKRGKSYFVFNHDDAGRYNANGLTRVRTFELRYVDPLTIETMLRPYLSGYGELTVDSVRKLLIVEDTPQFLDRITMLVADIDRSPRQIMIEAKILEIDLTDEEAFGIDWSQMFRSDKGNGGTQGLAGVGTSNSTGLFIDYAGSDLQLALNALQSRGRLRTLSTPKLVALENQEAEVIVGDRTGYQVTTTINQVTTESIEFLDSGVILRVTAMIEEDGEILLDIHPEVSSATVDANGIPSLTTTEVTTRMVIPNGQTIFIGGLIKRNMLETREGVPILGDIPGVGLLFSNKLRTQLNTETIVLITPRIVDDFNADWNLEAIRRVEENERVHKRESGKIEEKLNKLSVKKEPLPAPTAEPIGHLMYAPDYDESQLIADEVPAY